MAVHPIVLSLLRRCEIPVPPVGQYLALAFVNKQTACLTVDQRVMVKAALSSANLIQTT